ncbi:MAG: hydrolase [Rhodospirillales bacterium]|nr:hydrolase [Rhodospirillales bacterium]
MDRAETDRFHRTERRRACGNVRFDVFFDELRTAAGESVTDFMVVRPKVMHTGMIAGVCVLPEVAGRIGLMRSFRHHLDEEIWQAPAGFVEPDESTAESALRELREEALLTCPSERLQSLGVVLPDAGLIEGKVALFVARGAVALESGTREIEPGSGNLTFFSPPDLAELVRDSTAIGAATLVACFRYLASA